MNGACNSTKMAPIPGAWGRGQKSLNFNNTYNFKDVLYQTLCVFLQIKDIKHIDQWWDLGAQGLIVLTMVMWYKQLTEMKSRRECK